MEVSGDNNGIVLTVSRKNHHPIETRLTAYFVLCEVSQHNGDVLSFFGPVVNGMTVLNAALKKKRLDL